MNSTRPGLPTSSSSSPRSRRKHKAWGASPRKTGNGNQWARETGDSMSIVRASNGLSPALAGSAGSILNRPGAHAPGLMLPPASQAAESDALFVNNPAWAVSNACSISAPTSRTFSMPTEMRTRPSEIPNSCRRAGASSRCEAVAGCSTLVKTSPRLVERTHTFKASIKRKAASRVFSLNSIETRAPACGPRNMRLAIS
jgi:hypothetical protein